MTIFKGNSEMNIMISIDSNYILPAKVMLKSLSENIKEKLNVYLLYSKLSGSHIEEVSKFCTEKCKAILHPVYVQEQLFKGMPVNDRFPIETYFRLLALFILPENIERILWLDADIIIKSDITRFYWTDMGKTSISVMKDQGSKTIVSECHERLHLQKESVYFNSGVVLFNLKEIRKRWSKETLCDWMDRIQYRLEYPDQDILNLIFENDKLMSSNIWNYQIKSWTTIKKEDLMSVSIIHYVGSIKPWDDRYENRAKWIWWSYYCSCFDKRKYYIFIIKNMWNIFYNKYVEQKLYFVKKLIKKIIKMR